MVVKQNVNSLFQVVSKTKPVEAWYKRIAPYGLRENVIFPDIQTGVGKLVWKWDGDDWQKFADASDNEKPLIAKEYYMRKCQIQSSLKDAFLKDDIFVTPDDTDFVYYRKKNNSVYEFAIAGWGFKFVNKPNGDEIDTWKTKIPQQVVKIAFVWDEKFLPDVDFWINNLPRKTAKDGFFHIGTCTVGDKHNVVRPDRVQELLEVLLGQADYIYDLTKYFDVEISITKDGEPVADGVCDVYFNTKIHQLTTGTDGRAQLRLPLVSNKLAQIAEQQPPVKVSYLTDSLDKIPSFENQILTFEFNLTSPKIEDDPEPVTPEPVVPEPVTPEPVVIEPVVPEPVTPEPEPAPVKEFITFEVLDYGGYPLPDLDFVLTTKIKGKINLKTDSEGSCTVPKEWFTPDEKLNIKFNLSKEYLSSHDIHDGKK